MNLAASLVIHLAADLEPYLQRRRWYIAYSGGVDSHVLLHAIAALRESLPLPPITAIHINHRLNPRADDWALHCQRVCEELEIEWIIEAVVVEHSTGSGLEAAARRARYAAFEKIVGADELLLQAHHCDDQTETLLLRLLRGSGLKGLAAMPAQRPLAAGREGAGELLRPLLRTTRAKIIDYAQQQQLSWIHDDSNDSDSFDRNFLRLRVLPLLERRWPAYRNTLQRVTDNAAEAAELLTDLAALDYATVAIDEQRLSIANCLKLSVPRQRNLILYWLQQQRLPPPSSKQLAQILAIFAARADAEPCVAWADIELRRFRGCLYALRPQPAPQAFDREWQPTAVLVLPGCGTLRTSSVIGSGLRADRSYRVRNRRGGERCQPLGRAHSQTLKKLLQEYDVPPWLRDRLPLIYCGGEIAAVANFWVCEGYAAALDARGWHVEWQL
jgi:tRNA(Ile)-lysidine synthase